MSRTLTAPRRGSRVALVGLTAAVATVLAVLSLAPQANAAFTTGKCAGSDIAGRGASFARDAHGLFGSYFKLTYCLGTPGAGIRDVSYDPAGSGAGKTLMMTRSLTPRFGGTDEPPTPTEIAKMNAGMPGALVPGVDPDPDPDDNSVVHVVPAGVGAVAPLVNFPNGCDVNDLPADAKTAEQDRDGDSTPDDVIRVRFTKTQFEKIWAKDADADTWREVFSTLADNPACNSPIVRVVRFDNSGTTFALKDYLETINGGRGWKTTFNATPDTRNWPNATFGDRDDCDDAPNGIAEASDPDGPGAPGLVGDTDQLTSACANNNANLTTKLINTDGSVGYSDISTARGLGLAVTPEGNDNDTYWTQVPNGSGTFQEPTADPFGFRTDGSKGSNCQSTVFTGVPASTLSSWVPTSGVNSPVGFGICTLTYGLLFDDYSDAYADFPAAAEEAKARTVKDYWTALLSDGAQAQLFGGDYAPLPPSILAIARTGVTAIDWNKGAGGGGGGNTPPPGGNTPPPGGNEPPPTKPSNKFSVPRTTISSKTGSATLSVKLPGAGKLELVGTAKSGKRQIKVGRVVLTANKAGTFKLTLKPSKAAKKLLRKKGKLKVTLKLTYSPKGGTAKSSTRTVTLKLKQ